MDLHHIYPREWCKRNASALPPQPDISSTEAQWINSAANLMPMHRLTNNAWKDSAPATFLSGRSIDYDSRQEIWNWYFIDREAFNDLLAGEAGVESFWERRAQIITAEIHNKTAV